MNITPKLSLNKHPKDNLNLSFVKAYNVKVSQDESCVVNEEDIKENSFIKNFLTTHYGATVNYTIVGIIPCNIELVILVQPANNLKVVDIFRYRETTDTTVENMYCAYGGTASTKRFKYHGGSINGTFTYNVENSLIVSIAEFGVANESIPLRTVNLGNYDDQSVYNDKDVPNSLLSTGPEVRLPTVSDHEYVAGSAYKGWYYLFIRYKINTVDYTQWFPIGVPIYVDTIEQYQIIRYAYNRETKLSDTGVGGIVSPSLPDDGFCAGFSDYISNSSDVAKETFKVNIAFEGTIEYDKYQIGVFIASKSYTKSFRTSDIIIKKEFGNSPYQYVQEYVLDNKTLVEASAGSLIIDNFNYFNVKNVINYNNRLYISNYTETNANDKTIPRSIIDAIGVNLFKSGIRDYGLVYDTAIIATG